jgi:hypothetical protein
MMPPDSLIYPEAFSHFTSDEQLVLSHVDLGTIRLQTGCPVQCIICGVNAPLPDPSLTMEFERLRALTAGISTMDATHGKRFASRVILFRDAELPLYRSTDQHGNLVNFYHAAEEIFQATRIRTFLTTSGWPVGDNFVHGAMQMVIDNLGKETSPFDEVSYSLKTASCRALKDLDRFIDRCLTFLFTAPEEKVLAAYGEHGKVALKLRKKFSNRWSRNPENVKANLDRGNFFQRFFLWQNKPAIPEWIFMPFLDELFETGFFKRAAQDFKFLNSTTKDSKTRIKILDCHLNALYEPSKGLRKFKYFFGQDFMQLFLKRINTDISNESRGIVGIGRALENFNMSHSMDYSLTNKIASRGIASFLKYMPNVYFDVDAQGFMQLYFAIDNASFTRYPITKEYLLKVVKKRTGEERRLGEALAGLVGRNVFPDLDRPNAAAHAD